MSSLISWIKKQLGYLIDSLPEIIKGIIFFLLVFSGLGCAIMLRQMGSNGTTIAAGGVLVEAIAMILCYLLFKGYLKPSEEIKSPEPKKSKKR